MQYIRDLIHKDRRYLQMLAKQYPTPQNVYTEIINLQAVLNLPKGTEHFMSDIHGEDQAFMHILKNASGVIRDKVKDLFNDVLSEEEKAQLCALIYYPREKIKQAQKEVKNLENWYTVNLNRVIDICRLISSKYSRQKVRRAIPEDFTFIIEELLNANKADKNHEDYYAKIMDSIHSLGTADEFIIVFAELIQQLAVERLHIVGDIFDRGPRPDAIVDMLMKHHSTDIQWGNHDILWMGAACGNAVCIAGVVNISSAYDNLDLLEKYYGINLRPLAFFAEKTYVRSKKFDPRLVNGEEIKMEEYKLISKIHKAIAIIMLKLEGQVIQKHPEYEMDNRLLLDKMDLENGVIEIDGAVHPLNDTDFPTLNPENPYELSWEEKEIMQDLYAAFTSNQRLQEHVSFLYSHGNMYKCFNQNLLFHGSIPLGENGDFTELNINGKTVKGKEMMDLAEETVRKAFFSNNQEDKLQASDFIWYLWCGSKSPLFGRDRMTTFERMFIDDPATWKENSAPYYKLVENEEICMKILKEFDLPHYNGHIINGHVPVKVIKGESPVKANGKLIMIDGGFCKAYQETTGIAGYTLIYNSNELRLSAHEPFETTETAIQKNMDIRSSTDIIEKMEQRLKVKDTDGGNNISNQIYDLTLLLNAYRYGIIESQDTKH